MLSGFFALFLVIWDLYGCFLLTNYYIHCNHCDLSSLNDPLTLFSFVTLMTFWIVVLCFLFYFLFKYLKRNGFFQGYSFEFIIKEQIILLLFHSICFEFEVRVSRAFTQFMHFHYMVIANFNMSIFY